MDRGHSDLLGGSSLARHALVVTSDPDYVHDLTRLCAGAAVDAEVVADPAAVGSRWARASCVMVGEECAPGLARLGMRRRDGVLLVGRDPAPPELWRRAVEIGASDVMVLPADAHRIADRLAEAGAHGVAPGVVVGVVGVGGGAGASTIGASLAAAQARRGTTSLLVDADLLAGGIELLMGCEAVPGLRWPDIDVGEGRVAPDALLAALPSVDGVSVLSATRGHAFDLEPAAMRTMLGAGRRACSLVVVDLPRRFDASFDAAVSEIDVLLVVLTTQVRSVAAGRQLADLVVRSAPDVRAVVRVTPGRRLDPDAVADGVGLPLAGVVPTRRSISRAADDGVGTLNGIRLTPRYGALLDAIRAEPRA